MIDFVTIIFDNQVEIELLKLQALSFDFCEPSIIGKIFVFYNDNGNNKIDFIKEYYPENIRSKVNIIYRDSSFDEHCTTSDWKNQQYFKLYMSKYVESKYYVILDGKNHFIRKTGLDYFIKNDKPLLLLNNNSWWDSFMHGLNYFDIPSYNQEFVSDLEDEPDNPNVKLEDYKTSFPKCDTPYIMITNDVKNLISHIETKEKKTFWEFFMHDGMMSEFCLYAAYLIFSKTINKYKFKFWNEETNVVFRDVELSFNKIEFKRKAIQNENTKIFGLHRMAVENMDDNYKNNLLKLYSNFYDKKILDFIKSMLYK